MKILLISAISLFLIGCKAHVQTDVKLSELFDKDTKGTTGDLYLEITTCSDHDDSRIESKYLTKAKMKVPYIFKDAEYVECFRKGFNDYAHFKVPMMFDKVKNGKVDYPDHFNLVTNEATFLSLMISKELRDKIDNAKKEDSNFGKLEFEFDFSIHNDTDNNYYLGWHLIYLEGELPIKLAKGPFPKNELMEIKLSKLSTDILLMRASTEIISRVEKQDKTSVE